MLTFLPRFISAWYSLICLFFLRQYSEHVLVGLELENVHPQYTQIFRFSFRRSVFFISCPDVLLYPFLCSRCHSSTALCWHFSEQYFCLPELTIYSAPHISHLSTLPIGLAAPPLFLALSFASVCLILRQFAQ